MKSRELLGFAMVARFAGPEKTQTLLDGIHERARIAIHEQMAKALQEKPLDSDIVSVLTVLLIQRGFRGLLDDTGAAEGKVTR